MEKLRKVLLKGIITLVLAILPVVGAVPLPGLVATVYADNANSYYAAFLPDANDGGSTLANKVVKFNGIEWYIIEDNSTAQNARSVTLLAKNPIATSKFRENTSSNIYNASTVMDYLNGLIDGTKTFGDSKSFKDVKDAIIKVNTVDTPSPLERLYLLSTDEAQSLPENVRKCDTTNGNYWWLRSKKGNTSYVYGVNGNDGTVCGINNDGIIVNEDYAVRPALQLDLSKVTFVEDTRTFGLKYYGSYALQKDMTVSFNGIEWYIIEDNSTGENAGSVTLFAKDPIAKSIFRQEGTGNAYSGSTVETYLKGLIDGTKTFGESKSFKDVADAIKSVDLADTGVTGAKLYLLSTSEVQSMPDDLRYYNDNNFERFGWVWWLRSPYESNRACCGDGNDYRTIFGIGLDSGKDVTDNNAVRPALQLDLSKVTFVETENTRTFKLNETVQTYTVTLTGGANATFSSSTQNVKEGDPMETVTCTAKSGYHFVSDGFEQDGLKITRTSDTTLTISGTPTADVTITIPDAVKNTKFSAYLTKTGDDEAALAGKVVHFNALDWYVIEDRSETKNDGRVGGTLTLLAKEPLVYSKFDNNKSNVYSSSSVKAFLDGLMDGTQTFGTSRSFKNVSGAVKRVDLKDVSVSSAGLYLLSKEEAESLPANVRIREIDWWLRTPEGNDNTWMVGNAEGQGGKIFHNVVFNSNGGVCPALRLDLSEAGEFDPATRTFIYGKKVTVSLTGGANAAISGETTQTVLNKEISTVTYTAESGYHFERFDDRESNGIFVRRTSLTQITVSGLPTDNVSISIPDAVSDTAYTAYLPRAEDDERALKDKVVTFNGLEWYIIEDRSTAADAGSLTLFAKDPIASSKYYETNTESNKFSGSIIKGYLDGLVDGTKTCRGSRSFKDVAAAIKPTRLTIYSYPKNELRETVEDARLYLLSRAEVLNLPDNVKAWSDLPDDEWFVNGNLFWQITPIDYNVALKYVSAMDVILHLYSDLVNMEYYVRPAFRLDLSAITFSPQTREFKFKQEISAPDVTATYGDTSQRIRASVTTPVTGGGQISYVVAEGSEEYLDVDSATGALTVKSVPPDGKAYVNVTAEATDIYFSETKKVTVFIPRMDLNDNVLVIQTKKTSRAIKAILAYDSIASVTIDKPAVAEVSFSGDTIYVKAGKKKGKAVVTVTSAYGTVRQFNLETQTSKVVTKKLSVPKASKTVTLYQNGDTATVEVTARPDNISTGSSFTVTSSKKGVAKASIDPLTGKLKITAVSNGKSDIKVRCGNKSLTIKVNVKSPILVTGVKLNKTKMTVKVGSEISLKATLKPSKPANKKVTWTTDRPDLVQLTPNGLSCKIKALAEGKASVTVTTDDGSYTKTCKITVNPKKIAKKK